MQEGLEGQIEMQMGQMQEMQQLKNRHPFY
jgi:hypothetical protein